MGPRLTPMEEPVQSSKQNKRAMLINLLVLLAIFVVVTFVMPGKAKDDLFLWRDTDLLITCPDESSYSIPYDSITDISLVTDVDFGTCVLGNSDSNYQYGQWSNDTLGEYTLCAYRCFTQMIQITTCDGVFGISYESSETTAALYQSIVETLTQEGYVFTIG